MAITYFGSASNPADNGTQAGPTVAVTPPGSMATGDLVLMIAGYKNSGVTMTVSTTGGQTWTSETAAGGATSGLTMRLFWCRFNGTWAANPAVTITTGTLAMTVMMHVFRPTTGSNTWSVSGAQVVKDNSASTAMAAFGSGDPMLTVPSGDLGFHAVLSNDDNTYTNASTGYTTAGTVQYRNLQGNDTAMGAQYVVGDGTNKFPQINQATLGADTYAAIGIWFREASSGPTTYTLNVTAGSYTLTGQNSRLLMNRRIAVTAGNYAVTGKNINLFKALTLAVQPGDYSLTGNNARLLMSRRIAVTAGSYLLTGNNQRLLFNRVLSPTAGSYALTGNTANLLRAYNLTVTAGQYLVSGQNARLLMSRRLAVTAGSYQITGNDVLLRYNRLLQVIAGGYVVTGNSVVLTKEGLGLILDVQPGSYVIGGNPVNLLINRVLRPEAGSYEVAGEEVQLLKNRVLSVLAGEYNITGVNVRLSISSGTIQYFITGESLFNYILTGSSTISEGITDHSTFLTSITGKSIIV